MLHHMTRVSLSARESASGGTPTGCRFRAAYTRTHRCLTKGVPAAVIVVAGMIVYQQVENNVLQPLVYHRTVQVSALAVTVSVAAGAEIGGIVGALLGIPVAGALKIVSRELLAWRRGEDPPETAPQHGRIAA